MSSTEPANPPRSRRQTRLRAAAGSDAAGERGLETLALGIGAVAFVIVVLVALLVFRLQPAPISGPGSVGQFAAISGAVSGMVAFIAGRYILRGGLGGLRWTDVLDVAALAFAHGIIALLSWTLLADTLERGFIGAEVFAVPVLALSGAVAAVSAYLSFFSATHMDLTLLAIVLAVFLAEGVLASTLTASDPLWWEQNLSTLGISHDISALAFNLTLVVAGVIVTTLARYATSIMPTPNPRGARGVRTCLIVIGVFLGCVGIFHVDVHFWIHTAVASGMAVAFGVVTVRLPQWIPGLPRAFVLLGWLFLGVIVVLGVFFGVGYYTLTAVELVAGILIFAWLILLLRAAAALQTDAEGTASARP